MCVWSSSSQYAQCIHSRACCTHADGALKEEQQHRKNSVGVDDEDGGCVDPSLVYNIEYRSSSVCCVYAGASEGVGRSSVDAVSVVC